MAPSQPEQPPLVSPGREMDRYRNGWKVSGRSSGLAGNGDVYSSNGWPFDLPFNTSRPYAANNPYIPSQWADQDGPSGRLSTTLGQPPNFVPGDGNSEKPVNGSGSGRTVIVRGEEIGIVLVVLLLWVGAIILFFNRWGKIRMLEPYQPKFCEDHRPSCPMAEVTSLQQYPRTFSKCNIATDLIGSPHFAKCNYHGVSSYGLGPSVNRPRQNSVFVTSPHAVALANHSSVLHKASRKTKSAMDLSTLVLSEEFQENDEEENDKNSSEEEAEAEEEKIPLKPIIKKKTSIV